MTRSIPGITDKIHFSATSGHRVSRPWGFTLVEVLLSTVLISAVTALSIPSYQSMVDKRLLSRNVEQIATFLDSVQSVSALTNQVVTVSYLHVNHRNWCIGAVTGTAPCSCTQSSTSSSDYCAIEERKFVLDNTATNDMRLVHKMTGDGAYSIDPVRGLFQNINDSLTMEMHSDSSDFGLTLTVISTGQVTVCTKTQHESIPGYNVCS